MLDLRSIDANAIVLHGHLEVNPVVSLGKLIACALRKVHSHSDVPTRGRELDCIGKEVQNNLLESTAIE